MMINIFIFLSLAFLFTFLVGMLLERFRIPWIFAALILGALLAVNNPFSDITDSSTFILLADLGMYFLLFVIGFEIDLSKLKKRGKFIVKATFSIILIEAFFGALAIHFVFGVDWIVSFLVALSFATVGEAILVPILDEFKIVNTALGQAIIGIGTLDDIFEVLALVLVVALVGSEAHAHVSLLVVLASILLLFGLTYGLTKLKRETKRFSFLEIESLFLFTIFVLFLFLGVGEYADMGPLAALIAGMGIRTFMPKKKLKTIEREVKTMCYGFFAPIFFLWVGASMDVNYLLSAPLLILFIIIVASGSKILASYLSTKNELGTKKSLILGVGLTVRFSTSIVIVKILLDNGIIEVGLYSVLIAASIIFTFLVPIIFSQMLMRWGGIRKLSRA